LAEAAAGARGDALGSLVIVTKRDIAPRVHGLGSWAVNWYLIEDAGRLTAVDSGLPGFKGSLPSDLAALGYGLGDVEAVILTHSDADHTGLAAALHDGGAAVLIHSADEPKLRKPGPKSGDAKPLNIVPQMWRPSLWRIFGSMVLAGAARPTKVTDAATFGDGYVLDVPGHPRVIPTPGHTPGHCAFHFEDHDALFVGDAMCMLNPVTGSTGPQLMPSAMNESNALARQSLDAIERIEADVLLPGHGDPWRGGVAAAVELARAGA
jgi:glyoxylase-like metal-dependent hydrolase (beta-lactamase superfamily II)